MQRFFLGASSDTQMLYVSDVACSFDVMQLCILCTLMHKRLLRRIRRMVVAVSQHKQHKWNVRIAQARGAAIPDIINTRSVSVDRCRGWKSAFLSGRISGD
jgi:hypothetical protein